MKMLSVSRIKNRAIAKVTTRLPSVAKRFTEAFSTLETEGVPWTPLRKPLFECELAVVTTAGVHHREQSPFNMNDCEGDPTFRLIDVSRPIRELIITHDYYDHLNADMDINIVFPIQRLWELEREGVIGEVARFHYGFMGHIRGHHIEGLVKESAPEVARRLKEDGVDVVLLTPG
jgi:D-proline reductase (dithiol) PrdB